MADEKMTKEERATEKAINKDEKIKAEEAEARDADPMQEPGMQRMDNVASEPGHMYAVASAQQHPPVPADRSDPSLEPMAAPEEFSLPAEKQYVVLVTQLGNNFSHGMVVSRQDLERDGVDVDGRLAVGAIATVDSGDPRVPAAIEEGNLRHAAQLRNSRDSGVARR